ncbi:MAG TPA: hypothetical protein VLM76_13470 [Patescibacteria group bacterium]|nr:hypothetical protein [Patescibacteria group bacterium]
MTDPTTARKAANRAAPADPRESARHLLPTWQDRLRLGDWRIAVSDLEPDPDDRSTIDLHVAIRQAAIRLRGDTPPSQVERQLVHELLHVRFALAEQAWRDTRQHTPPAFDPPNRTLWEAGVEAAIEALTDALGCAPRADWGPSAPEFSAAFPVADPR